MSPWLIGILVVGGVFLLWAVSAYNGLVRLRNHVKNGWSQIDVQLKRRHDLVPNLVETVKGYAGHEKETLERVMKARSNALGAHTTAEASRYEGELSQALGRLMMVVEQYPNLKANENFLSLQEELTSTENKISFSRQYYNDTVMHYNNKIQSLPTNLIAAIGGFAEEEFFELEDKQERQAPKVSFS